MTTFIRFGIIFLPQDPINISVMTKINFKIPSLRSQLNVIIRTDVVECGVEVEYYCHTYSPYLVHSDGKFLKFKINQNGLKLPIIILDL